LLDRSKEWLYRHYREQYAEQLSIWNLIMQRAEILKFNGLVSYWPEKKTEKPPKQGAELEGRSEPQSQSLEPPPGPYGGRRLSPSHSPHDFSFNPEAHEFLPGTQTPLQLSRPQSPRDAGEPFQESLSIEVPAAYIATDSEAPKDDAGKAVAAPSMCAVCWMRLQGLFVFCARCGHAAHKACVPSSKSGSFGGNGNCAAYCGCECGGEDMVEEKPDEWWRDASVQSQSGGTQSKDWRMAVG